MLAGIAEELETGLPQGLGFRTSEQVWREMTEVGPWDGERVAFDAWTDHDVSDPGVTLASDRGVSTGSTGGGSAGFDSGGSDLVLASWKQLLDDGRMQDGDEAMRRTARKPVLMVGRDTLDAHGLAVGDLVTLSGPRGSVDLPVALGDLAEGTVWAPATSPGLPVRTLVGPAGSPVTLSPVKPGDRTGTTQGGPA